MTRYVLDIDDSQWKADHLPRVLRTTESVWLNELACQVEIQIVDARPLIVLDLDENDARHLVSYLEITVEEHPEQLGSVGRAIYTNVADQIEAQTKPPKPFQPMGVGAVVRAITNGNRSRTGGPVVLVKGACPQGAWHSGDLRYDWEYLEDVEVLSEGVNL